MVQHALGLRLGKTIEDIAAMPYDEFVSWIAFFELQRH